MASPLEYVNKDRIVQLAETLVSIPSVTNQEHEISDWAYEHFKSIGLAGVQRFPVEESGDSVIGWIDGPADGPALMFNFHLDTFPICDGWDTDPLAPHLEDGRLYGLGAHDMKGGGACVLAAVEAILASGIELGGRLSAPVVSGPRAFARALRTTGPHRPDKHTQDDYEHRYKLPASGPHLYLRGLVDFILAHGGRMASRRSTGLLDLTTAEAAGILVFRPNDQTFST